MKRHMLLPLAALLMGAFTLAVTKDKTFKGEIMDSPCAMDGSHAKMLKMEGMGDKDPNDHMAKQMCTNNCVKKMSAKYVLYDAAKKKTYELDDQTKPEQFAGKNVNVTGTLDKDGKTLHVTNIASGS